MKNVIKNASLFVLFLCIYIQGCSMSSNIKAVKEELDNEPIIYVKVLVSDTSGMVYFMDDEGKNKGTRWGTVKAQAEDKEVAPFIAEAFKDIFEGYNIALYSDNPLPEKKVKATFGSYITTDYEGTDYDMEMLIIIGSYYSVASSFPEEITLTRNAYVNVNKITEDKGRDNISKYSYPLATVSRTFEYEYDSRSGGKFLSDMLDLALEMDGKDPVYLVEEEINPPKLEELIKEMPPEVLDEVFIIETKNGIKKFFDEVNNSK